MSRRRLCAAIYGFNVKGNKYRIIPLINYAEQIRIVRTLDPAELGKRADDLSRRHRILDVAVQEANWSTELMD